MRKTPVHPKAGWNERTQKYILKGHELVPVDLLTWARWFETANRHVAVDWPVPGIRVSTVFLGFDQSFPGQKGPPLFFETMIFGGGELDEKQWRYSTWEEAERGHAAAVALVLAKAKLPLGGRKITLEH